MHIFSTINLDLICIYHPWLARTSKLFLGKVSHCINIFHFKYLGSKNILSIKEFLCYNPKPVRLVDLFFHSIQYSSTII